MKKLLALLILSALLLSSCAIGRGGDIEKLDPFGTDSDAPIDTTEPVGGSEDTTDTPVSDSEDTTEPADTGEPDENVFYESEKYKITVTEDGEYLYRCESQELTRVFEDAFILEGHVYLVSEGNGVCTLHAPSEHGQLKSRMNASKFTKCGDFIWADGKLYDWQLVEIFALERPYYLLGSFTVTGVDYDEETGVISVRSDLEGKEFIHKFYSKIPTDTPIPASADLIEKADLTSGLISALYLADDGSYYFKYDYMSVKLPVEGEFDDVMMVTDNKIRLVRMVDGNIETVELEYLIKGTSTGQCYAGFAAVEANLGAPENYVSEYTQNYEYNGALVISMDPRAYVIKDGEIVLAVDNMRFSPKTIGEYLVIGYDDFEPYYIIKPDLTLFSDKAFHQVEELTAGNIFASYVDGGAVVFDTNGTVAYEFDESLDVMQIGVVRLYDGGGTATVVGEWALVKWKEDNTLRLLNPYGQELCNFGELFEDYYFHRMLTGYYSKEGYPTGLYFIFEDRNDQNPDKTYGHHSYEYYYSFETGEYGMIDLGYVDYAYAKPVLYLYPTEATDVTVTFEHPERLTVDYPKYTDGWRVTAMPDGTLKGENGREYYALYWEEDSESAYYTFPDGFCVSGDDSAAFLEEKLAALGFTDKEANEFIIYWLPILEASEYNLIRFELTDEREASNALHINPVPDSLLRVAMHIKAVDAPVNIREQRLPAFERVGFAAVEWGGCIH